MDALREADGFAAFRMILHEIAETKGHYSGIPMPLDQHDLVVEPTHPMATYVKLMEEMRAKEAADAPPDPDAILCDVVNVFYSEKWRCYVKVLRTPEGRIIHDKVPAAHHLLYDLNTMSASDAWGIEQEAKAIQLLGTMIRHHQFKRYMLTGMFVETSRRSGVPYIFRRLKPTVALRPWHDKEDVSQQASILCCLCQHPIAYYKESWAGAMCPTDDVIAHLTMMRADEVMFWRRSNQHPPGRPEAGL